MINSIFKFLRMKNLCLFKLSDLACLVLLLTALQINAAVTVRYQHTDALGSVIMETDSTGQIIGSKHQYTPFGEGINGQKNGLGYTGHLEDADIGLTYMQQRYYDPVVGRFYSNDPVGFSVSNPIMFNRYAYANNNPYKYFDPDGRSSKKKGDSAAQLGILIGELLGVIEDGDGMRTSITDGKIKPDRAPTNKGNRASKVEKHHVVPQSDRRAAGARNNMVANGIKPKTEKTNLVDIPGDKHDITKRESYIRSTNDRIENQIGADEIRSECCKIADELTSQSVEELDKIYPKKK